MEAPQDPDRTPTLTEAIYGRIRNDILLGVLKPGDKLKLDPLRLRYAASVNTLRETLARLVSEGLVANEGQRGFTVVPASLGDLRDITEMRRMLECRAVELSIARADLDWESRLVATYHKLSKISTASNLAAAAARSFSSSVPLNDTVAIERRMATSCGG